MMSKPECFITGNGIRTVVQEDPSLLHQSFVICVDTTQAGNKDLNNTHALEHILLRDEAQFNGQSLSQVVDQSANHSYAATYPELVVVTLDCVPSAIRKLFPALLATLADPVISEETVEREKTAIASEMRERASDPVTGAYERAWHNHKFTHTAEQEAATLPTVNSDNLRSFHKRIFTSDNIYVVTAGPEPVEKIARYITDSSLQPGRTERKCIGTRDFQTAMQPIVTGNETVQTNHYLRVFNLPHQREVALVLDGLNNSERNGSFWYRASNDIGVYSAELNALAYPYAANARYYLGTEGEIDEVKRVHELGTVSLLTFPTAPNNSPELTT